MRGLLSVCLPIQFTLREPHPLAGSAENRIRWQGVGAAAMPEFSELRVLNCRSTCVRKNG